MAWDLSNYETVKERKARFYSDHKDGRIIVEAIEIKLDMAVFKAIVFKNAEDQKSNLPFATGHALEMKGQGGMANTDAWTENCEESAIGRALDNAGYSGNKKASKEEMLKVVRGHASGNAAVKQEQESSSIGEYVGTFGKYKDHRLNEFPIGELLGYVEFISNKAKAEHKPITGKVKEFFDAVQAYKQELNG